MTAQKKVAQDGNVLESADPMAAGGTLRTGDEKIVARCRLRRLARKLGALGPPSLFQHPGKAMYDDIEEAADAKTDDSDEHEQGHGLGGHGLTDSKDLSQANPRRPAQTQGARCFAAHRGHACR